MEKKNVNDYKLARAKFSKIYETLIYRNNFKKTTFKSLRREKKDYGRMNNHKTHKQYMRILIIVTTATMVILKNSDDKTLFYPTEFN